MRPARPSFTDEVRQELAQVAPARACDRRAELAALLRFGGALHVSSNGRDASGHALGIELWTAQGAVARRAYRLARGEGADASLEAHEPGALQRTTRFVVWISGAAAIAAATGLVDHRGHPVRVIGSALVERRCDASAFLRGALMACGNVSRLGRPAHLELRVETEASARTLADLVRRVVGERATVVASDRRVRVVVKSGAAIGALLAQLGAPRAFLAWDDARLRRELRADVVRAANADAANARRSAAAAAEQRRVVARAVSAVGWEALPPALREVALARVANPEASLAEVGALCDPPVGKAAVLRRLERLDEVARASLGR